jgi:hypothetical protein
MKPSTPSKPAATEPTNQTEPIESKTPPGTPPKSPALSSGPDTPVSERVVPVGEGAFMLDEDELNDMDDELKDFMGDEEEDDRTSQTTDDTDDASMTDR